MSITSIAIFFAIITPALLIYCAASAEHATSNRARQIKEWEALQARRQRLQKGER